MQKLYPLWHYLLELSSDNGFLLSKDLVMLNIHIKISRITTYIKGY